MRRAAALLLLLAACERSDGLHATRAQCERLGAERQAMADRMNARNGPWFMMRVFGDGGPERCMERMTAHQVDCMIAKLRADDMDTSACKPEVDLRPPDARHTPAECARYVAKSRELATVVPPRDGLTSAQLADAVAHRATVECAGWLSRAHYECVLAATTDDARRACPL